MVSRLESYGGKSERRAETRCVPWEAVSRQAPKPALKLLLPLRRLARGGSRQWDGTERTFSQGDTGTDTQGLTPQAKLRSPAQKRHRVPVLTDRWQVDRWTNRSRGSGLKKGREDDGLQSESGSSKDVLPLVNLTLNFKIGL